MSSSKQVKVWSKFQKLCLDSDHRTIQKMIETDLHLDIWELKCAFTRKCAECCLKLMKTMDFGKIRVLRFDFEWENIPEPKYASDDNKTLPWEIPILYLAIYAELLDVVEYIVGTAPEELKVGYGGYSVLEFVFTQIDNEELRNFFFKDEIFKKCVRVISRRYPDICDSDLVKAFIHEDKFPYSLVEKLLDLVMECQNQGDRCSELQYIIKISLYKPNMKLKYLDMLLQKNKYLLNEAWSNDDSFFAMLMKTEDIEFIEEMYEKYHPNLLIMLRDERTVFYRCIYRCLFFNDSDSDFKYLAKKLLEWEPKLADIPEQYEGLTPLMLICRYNILECMDIFSLLIEKYGVDINAIDFSGKSALYYATKCVKLKMLIFLLENHATMDNLILADELSDMTLLEGDEIKEKADDVIKGSLRPDIFNSMILCLVKVYGAGIQNLNLDQNDIVNGEILKTIPIKDFLERFQKVYSTLINYRILDFNSFLQEYVKSQIETDFKDSFVKAKLQMCLATAEIHFYEFDMLPHQYYSEDGFQSVKEFISIKNFNSICMGREMPTLKHLCRSVVRKGVFKRWPNKIPIDSFKTLEIPFTLMQYLCFLDNIPI